MDADAVATVHAWHEALNTGDVERLIALSSDDVEVGGPRGSGRGAELIRDWFGRAGIHIEPHRTFHRNDTVVVEEGATWKGAEVGTATEPQTVASVFVVQDGRVTSVVRHVDLASALEAGRLSFSDEMR